MSKVELEFMPIARRWRILIDGKAIPRRFSDRATAMREFEKRLAQEVKGIPQSERVGRQKGVRPEEKI